MARIAIQDGQLTISITGLHQFLALKSRLQAPLAHIGGVTPRPPLSWFDPREVRVPGTEIPWVVRAGSYYRIGDGWRFYALRDPRKSIAIDLVDEHYKRIVVQLDEETPDDAVRRITVAMRADASPAKP